MNLQGYSEEEELSCFIVFLTWLFPSSLEENTVVIDTPVGVLCWRINQKHIDKYKHLPVNMDRQYDLKTDKEKYDLLLSLGKKVGGIVVALGMISGLGDKK